MRTSTLRLMQLGIAFLLCFAFNDAIFAGVKDRAAVTAIGLGHVVQSYDGKEGMLFLFEESHNSVYGQIEIAHMLVRLYRHDGLRSIGLEGAFAVDNLRPEWAKGKDARARLRLASRLLGEGELSSAEFMASAFSDVTVRGIDNEQQYARDLDALGSAASTFYLVRIAETSLSTSQVQRVSELTQQKKVKEAIDLVIGSDPWTKKKYQDMDQSVRVVSIEEMLRHVVEIEQEAARRKVQIDPKLAQAMKSQKEFFEAAAQRSDTMVEQIVSISKSTPAVPTAAVIGAAHTERMTRLLKERSISFAVIRPLALQTRGAGAGAKRAVRGTPGLLNDDAYVRKSSGKSVDASGLGALLDGRQHKPRPVLATPWLNTKANVYHATSIVVKRILAGDQPPYKFAAELEQLPGIHIDPQQIRVIDDEIVFAIRVDMPDGKSETIWVRAAYSDNVRKGRQAAEVETRISKLLAEAGDDGGGMKPPGGDKSHAPSEEPGGRGNRNGKSGKTVEGGKTPNKKATEVTEGLFAIYDKNPKSVEGQRVFAKGSSQA